MIVPEAQVRPVLAAVSAHTLQAVDPPGLDDGVLLLVPDAHGRRRAPRCCALVAERGGVAGPARPWLEVRASYDRALRALDLGLLTDTEAAPAAARAHRRPRGARRPARPGARAARRARPATADKLAETLRAWLLLQGRRDEVAEALFVHPQTVRYRMGQLREAFGDRLDDPEEVLALTLALALEPTGEPPATP